MGRPIVQRLLKSGFKVAAYDRDRSKAEELIRYGGTVAESVAKQLPLVLSCLPTMKRSCRLSRSRWRVRQCASRRTGYRHEHVYPETSWNSRN